MKRIKGKVMNKMISTVYKIRSVLIKHPKITEIIIVRLIWIMGISGER